MSEEQTFCEDFESSLSDLTLNSKPLINMLTMLAEENSAYAPHVVRLIEERLNQAKSTEKLPVLYLLDSILKNVNGTYQSLFTKNIVSVFCGVFAKVDEKTRQAMFKLRTTWNEYFPANKLHPLDVQVNSIDPAWPIMTPPPQQPTIHVNPKFIKKADSGSSVLGPTAPTPTATLTAPTLTTPPTSVMSLNDDLQKQVDQEKQEALMRQQLIAKQHELLQLQQKKLEMELQQTKSRIELQTRDLEQKKAELAAQAQKKLQLEQQQLRQQLEQQRMQQEKLMDLQSQHSHLKVTGKSQQLTQVPQGDTNISKPQPVAAIARDPRINNRDPRIRDPRLAQQKVNPQPKVTAPAVQEIIKELANSPRLSPLADSPPASPTREIPKDNVPVDKKKTDNVTKKKKTSPKASKDTSVKQIRQYRKGERNKQQNQSNRTESKTKTNNKSVDSKTDKKENKPEGKEITTEEIKGDNKIEASKTGKDKKNQPSHVARDRKSANKKDSGKFSDKSDKRDKPKEKKTEAKSESDKSTGNRRNSAEDKNTSTSKSPVKSRSKSPIRSRSKSPIRSRSKSPKRSRSKSPVRSRSKSPLRTGPRSPRSRGLSPKSDSRRYMARSRSPLRRNRRDIKDRIIERKGRDARFAEKNRKENEEREDVKITGGEGTRGRDSFLDDRFPRRRPGDFAGPDFPPKKRVRMGREQENTWDDWRRQGWSNRQWSRPPGRRPIERRLSLDPDVKIPKELTLSKQKDIIEQAEKQLNSGQLSHKEHQDLLMQLNDLYQLQRIKQQKMSTDAPVVYSRYDWPARDYDARRDTDAPQTYFKGIENAPVREPQPQGQNTAKDVDERILDTMLMPPIRKTDSPGQNEEMFGTSTSKGDVDMRELPLSDAQNRQVGNSQSSQSRNYPPPLMSIPVRAPVGSKEENTDKMRFANDADRKSPLPEDNSMFGPTDRDMRRSDEPLAFGPGMKDKDMRQLPAEGSALSRDHPRHDSPVPNIENRGPVELQRTMREDQRSMIKGPRGRSEGPGQMMDGSREIIEGQRPMVPGPGRKMEGPRPMIEGPRPTIDGPRPMVDAPRPMMTGPRPMRPMMEGMIRPEASQMQGMNAPLPMMPQNMLGQLMARSAVMPGQLPNQTLQQMMPNQTMANQQFNMGAPMMTQPPTFGMMGPTQQMSGIPTSLPGVVANMGMATMGMQQQSFPMAGPAMGMVNFGMGGPMVPQGIPQHVVQPQNVATPPQQEATTTPIDVNALFSKLLQSGIISKGGDNSPRQGVDTPPPQSVSQEESKKPDKEEESEEDQQDLLIPEIGFYPEELRVRFQGVINRIYNGIQCSSCGLRYMPEEMDRYAKHLDWHFRLNRREKDGAKKATSRKWYYKVDDWVKFEEIDDIEEGARSEFFELQARLGLTDLIKKPNQITSIAVTGDDDSEEVCDICQESFEQFWDEEEEQWQLKDAVRVDGKTYHPLCYEDTKDVTVVPETPTPVSELTKPEFPVSTAESTTPSKIPEDSKPADAGQQQSTESSTNNEQTKQESVKTESVKTEN